MTAMPLMIGILCLMAIAYRYYSAFLAAKVAALDDSVPTPAIRINDGQNFHPTNRWVLFGHHFAAISGAGPLIGPVLAAQFGYLPGLLWIVIGVCLAGAVQDFLVLSMSTRRGGRSLAQICFGEVGNVAGWAATLAILFIIVIALAGLGKVVVKALGGEEVKYPVKSVLELPAGVMLEPRIEGDWKFYEIPAGTRLLWGEKYSNKMTFSDRFVLRTKQALAHPNDVTDQIRLLLRTQDITSEVFTAPTTQPSTGVQFGGDTKLTWANWAASTQPLSIRYDATAKQPATQILPLPPDAVRLVPGSSWGTFTIACTIPIALLVGLWMYKIRPGRVVEASLIGAALTIGATFLGGLIPGSSLAHCFDLKDTHVTWAMAIYGFVASILPVWILLCPRDYLSSFLKIGTIAILVGGVIIANPTMQAPAFNEIFFSGGPTVKGKIFPFLFITVMCGAISGFHALVSSGTTPKMIARESHARTIGYGAMLIEGLVGVVAMFAAATLPVGDYYAMNTDLAAAPAFADKFTQIGANVDHLNVIEERTQESLRGRTGGAVTLAVGMAHIFDQAGQRFFGGLGALWKYWYHFAIMFEALFILTTIDTGTRIGRFLLQEFAGKLVHPKLGETSWWPGAIVSSALVVWGWAYFINANSFAAIWAMFGVANQMLAVIALAIVSAYLANAGRQKYLAVTLIPLAVVLTTTSTAAVQLFIAPMNTVMDQLGKSDRNPALLLNSSITAFLLLAMMLLGWIVVGASLHRILFKEIREPAAAAA